MIKLGVEPHYNDEIVLIMSANIPHRVDSQEDPCCEHTQLPFHKAEALEHLSFSNLKPLAPLSLFETPTQSVEIFLF